MTFVPGFDPHSLTDDQLLERSQDLMRKLNWIAMYGSGAGVESMQLMLQAIETERRERMFMERWKVVSPYLNDVIETDPVLREAERPSEPTRGPRALDRSKASAGRRIVPTATPVVPPDQPAPKPEP